MIEKFIPFVKWDSFLWKDYLKKFRQEAYVGFVIDEKIPYNKAMASIRLRCYNIMDELERQGIHAEIYNPKRNYKVLVFTKCFSDKAKDIANFAYKKGIPIIDDAYFENFGDVNRKKDEQIIRDIVEKATYVITVSEVQQKVFARLGKETLYIPEAIDSCLLEQHKEQQKKDIVTLVYCGYSAKAKDLLVIKDIILEMQQKYNSRLLIISDADPQIKELNYDYMKYDQKRIANQIKQGDIMIAPRPMDNIERSSHSVSKIALPMAVGIPAIASPVPSYYQTPAILCNNADEWKMSLENLIINFSTRKQIAEKGHKYVMENLTLEIIGKKYKELINVALKNKMENKI